MNDEAKKTLARIRTFAQDLNAEKAKRDQHPKTDNVVVAADTKKPVEIIEPETVIKEEEPATIVKAVIEKPEEEKKEEPVKETPAKIPAFHELQKKIAQINSSENLVEKNKKPKLTKTKEEIKKQPKVNVGFDATVITDTKANRFKLMPSILESFKAWLKTIKPKKKKLPPPKYTVPETSHRKGVIQKATSKTGTVFSADNETIKEQIRLRQLKESSAEASEEVEPETTWSPFTETGYNLLESPKLQKPDVTQNVVLEYKKIIPPVPAPEINNEESYEVEPETNDSINPSENGELGEEELFDNRWSNTEADDGVKTIEVSEPLEEATPEPVSLNKIIDTQAETEIIATKNNILDFKTNTLTVTSLILVISTLFVFFVTRLVLNQINFADEAKTGNEIERLLNNSELNNLVITTSDVNNIPELINSKVTNGPMGLVELPIISKAEEEITPAYIFNLLKLKPKPNFVQSITKARFVTFNQSKPVLILKFADKNTVKGGLLNWEISLFDDLNVIYQNQTAANPIEFKDEVINDLDVRMLKGGNETLIIYGFVNDNTVVISPDVFTFEELVKQLSN